MEFQKDTKRLATAHGKWYADACGAAFAMELIGERWSLPIIRELMFGGRRFSDIRNNLPGLSAKTLTERLDSLEAIGVVTRQTLGAPAPAKLYALTPWGLALEPVMQELGRWSVQSPGHNPMLPLTPVSLMLSLRTMIDPERAKHCEAKVRLEVGADRFDAHLRHGDLRIVRAADDFEASIVFRAPDANAYLWVFYGKRPLGSPALTLEAEGDPELIERFIAMFRLPEKRRATV